MPFESEAQRRFMFANHPDIAKRWATETPKKKLPYHKKKKKMDDGGNVNRTGYLKDSKTKDNDYNIIPSGNITTENMAFPIFANGKLLLPNTGDYKFDTNFVLETPALNKGGTMKKGKLRYKSKKMQAGGVAQYASLGFDNKQDTSATLGAVGEGLSLLAPHKEYTSTNAPTMGLGDAMAGAKAGMAFGPEGAIVGGALGLGKDFLEHRKDVNDFEKNIQTTQKKNLVDFNATHQPYGQYGANQGTPTRQVYSLFDGGNVQDPMRKKAYADAMANVQTSHSPVSLSKQEGGEIPSDLNELFDRAVEESGGDEEKAHELVMKHAQNPNMKKKPQLKKKKK